MPDNAVAAMNPAGGKVVRVNEAFDEMNPDLGDEEYAQLSPESEELSADEILSKFDDETEEEPSFPDQEESHLAGDDEEIAGIDDMSGVGREDILNGVVKEAVDSVIRKKNLDVIAESVVTELLKEDGEKQYKHDSEFRFQGPDYSASKNKKMLDGGLSNYMAPEGKRVKNLHLNPETKEMEYYDDTPGAPQWVNVGRKEYDKNSPYYGQNKYGLNLNDTSDDETQQGAWETTGDVSRKFQNYFLSQGVGEMIAAGAGLDDVDADKIGQTFRHGVFVLQKAKNALAQELGISPRMIENFLSSNFSFGKESVSDEDDAKQTYVDSLNNSGYRDAKVSQNCIVLPDGELPLTRENLDYVEENYGEPVIGPSLKAVGFMHSDGSDMSYDELKDLMSDCLMWLDGVRFEEDPRKKETPERTKWSEVLDTEEEVMKSVIEHLNSITSSDAYKSLKGGQMKSAISQWYSIIEQFGALNKRDEAKDRYGVYGRVAGGDRITTVGRGSVNGGLVSPRAGLSEETTVLHDFGKHPGYRKKPMAHPENVEDAPNGAKDWNDDSAKSQEPFGKQIGSSEPYTQVVRAITQRVLETLAASSK